MVTSIQNRNLNHHQMNSTSTFLQLPPIDASPYPLFPMYASPLFIYLFIFGYEIHSILIKIYGVRMRRWGWC